MPLKKRGLLLFQRPKLIFSQHKFENVAYTLRGASHHEMLLCEAVEEILKRRLKGRNQKVALYNQLCAHGSYEPNAASERICGQPLSQQSPSERRTIHEQHERIKA